MMTILITGSSSGVGKAIAKALLEKNYQVIGVSRTTANLHHKHYTEYLFDLMQPDAVEKSLKIILKNHTIDGLIYAAGVGRFGFLEQLKAAEFNDVMQVNCLSAMIMSKALIPIMKQKNQGFCIYIGSEAALAGAKQSCIYSASKFALRGFVQSLQEEVRASHINVTLINPGLLKTNFHKDCHFKPADNIDSAIDLNVLVLQVVLLIENQAMGFVSEINLKPYKNMLQSTKS